jgi:hypothetical protein
MSFDVYRVDNDPVPYIRIEIKGLSDGIIWLRWFSRAYSLTWGFHAMRNPTPQQVMQDVAQRSVPIELPPDIELEYNAASAAFNVLALQNVATDTAEKITQSVRYQAAYDRLQIVRRQAEEYVKSAYGVRNR